MQGVVVGGGGEEGAAAVVSAAPREAGRRASAAAGGMVLLDLDQFLLRVGRLYKSKKAGGSVWLTFKRISGDAKARKGRKNARKLSGDGEAVLLARATDGAKVKLSCEVSAKDHLKFQIAVQDLLKLELDGLKKR